jgi:predicted ATPase/DNA-binding CsgD family transcriptional regulator
MGSSGQGVSVRPRVPGLPFDLTSFEGRRGELSDVKVLLGEHRLVTLTGFGGIGKTRLALRAAREMSRTFPDGVGWVELADIRDPALIIQGVIDALQLADRPGRDSWGALVQDLRERRMLLVFDNCEHVLADVAEMIGELLRTAPGLRVLATSRQVLGIPGEMTLPVAPLPVPPADGAEPGATTLYASLALLQERAGSVLPGFEITPANESAAAELCRKLDGIPLAIELAAVKLKVLSLPDLVERLDTRLQVLRQPGRAGPDRHATIEATIDWSYELCTPDERLLWARASVFAGGFSIAAAERVCSDEKLPESSVLDVVLGLVDKSVLTRSEVSGQIRFRLLEPLREHGLRRLSAEEEYDDIVHRHILWCEELLDEACLQWFGPTQEQWCTTLQLELPNVRAAVNHCLGHDDCTTRALDMVGKPWFLWIALFLDEGRQWLERVVALCPEPSPSRAHALSTLGYVAALQGDLDRAEEVASEGRAMAESLGDDAGIAYATHILGLSALFHDGDRSVDLLTQALPLYERADVVDDYVVGLRIQLGLAHLFRGNLVEAEAQFELCQELCGVTGERWLLSYALYGHGFVRKLEGESDASIKLACEAIEIKWFFRDLCGLSTTMDLLAWSQTDAGRYSKGATLLGAASSLWDRFGVRLFGSDDWLAMMKQAEQACREHLGQRAYDTAYQAGREMSSEEAIELALGKQEAPVAQPEKSAIRLTPREDEISLLVAEGLSNKAIAERLVISQRTAEGHVENVLNKLGFRSRSQIAAWVGARRSSHVV